jgi:predicted site-specific integrase-resolvase
MKQNEFSERFLTPKEVFAETGLKPSLLKKYRQKGHLKNIKWSVGKGKPYYEINEVKKLFHKN